MEEKIFLNKGNVSVSNSRFIVDGQTYAISNVTSVKSGEIPGSYSGAIILMIIALCFFAGGVFMKLLGTILLMFAIYVLTNIKSTYTVILNTSAGENKALSSQDKTHVESIVTALNDAIVSRG
ncbi:DUF6232 family protein [Shewanella polaris]|uniref:QacE n=1 Tax=Shewanella polaris TaxID=2588449 RepID=A0A4Y5YIE4_9GAMM|nr:DUF6232 family protein [Shewanella polaris]QDE32378.1 QacE [Shewanella polaris]